MKLMPFFYHPDSRTQNLSILIKPRFKNINLNQNPCCFKWLNRLYIYGVSIKCINNKGLPQLSEWSSKQHISDENELEDSFTNSLYHIYGWDHMS